MRPYNAEGLTLLNRSGLQAIAKLHGIRANMKSTAIIQELVDRFPDGVPFLQIDPQSIHTTPTDRKRTIFSSHYQNSSTQEDSGLGIGDIIEKIELLCPPAAKEEPPLQNPLDIPRYRTPTRCVYGRTLESPGPGGPDFPVKQSQVVDTINMMSAVEGQNEIDFQAGAKLRSIATALREQASKLRQQLQAQTALRKRLHAYIIHWKDEPGAWTFNQIWNEKIKVWDARQEIHDELASDVSEGPHDLERMILRGQMPGQQIEELATLRPGQVTPDYYPTQDQMFEAVVENPQPAMNPQLGNSTIQPLNEMRAYPSRLFEKAPVSPAVTVQQPQISEPSTYPSSLFAKAPVIPAVTVQQPQAYGPSAYPSNLFAKVPAVPGVTVQQPQSSGPSTYPSSLFAKVPAAPAVTMQQPQTSRPSAYPSRLFEKVPVIQAVTVQQPQTSGSSAYPSSLFANVPTPAVAVAVQQLQTSAPSAYPLSLFANAPAVPAATVQQPQASRPPLETSKPGDRFVGILDNVKKPSSASISTTPNEQPVLPIIVTHANPPVVIPQERTKDPRRRPPPVGSQTATVTETTTAAHQEKMQELRILPSTTMNQSRGKRVEKRPREESGGCDDAESRYKSRSRLALSEESEKSLTPPWSRKGKGKMSPEEVERMLEEQEFEHTAINEDEALNADVMKEDQSMAFALAALKVSEREELHQQHSSRLHSPLDNLNPLQPVEEVVEAMAPAPAPIPHQRPPPSRNYLAEGLVLRRSSRNGRK
ncbi:hypothetical protein BDQ12DRAFT_661542 [Crucibulum laeve]|uniref:Uncharacterized protein n=1 Tax=Crucibulum laeve TaxID=68775 RepID=A0A5C3MJ27_9AGAR|nr:hypothetical protein BDQ12DRAFT_661542 [Crucibulum laeve]